VSPRIVGYGPYRPYYYGYRPGLTIGFYAGLGYPYGYPYYYGNPYYDSGYYAPYAYPPPVYGRAQPSMAYGGVRVQGAPHDAQVFVDGYYMGIADDFDGPTQHLNLEAGEHDVEIRTANQTPVGFTVLVQPDQTVTVHAGIVR
jgi:hypothetical protein